MSARILFFALLVWLGFSASAIASSNPLLQVRQLDVPSRPDLGCSSMFSAEGPGAGFWELSSIGTVSLTTGFDPLGFVRGAERYPIVQDGASAMPSGHADLLLRVGHIREDSTLFPAMQILEGQILETPRTVRYAESLNFARNVQFLKFDGLEDFSYIVFDGNIYRFDAFSPSRTWVYTHESLIKDIAVVAVGQGDLQIAFADDEQILFLDADTGTVVRSLPISGVRKIARARLNDSGRDQLVILNSDFENNEFDRLRAIDAGTLQPIWTALDLEITSVHVGDLLGGPLDEILVSRLNFGNQGISLLDSEGRVMASNNMDPSSFNSAHFTDITGDAAREILVSRGCRNNLEVLDQQLMPLVSHPDYGAAPYAEIAAALTDDGRRIVYSFTSDPAVSATPSFVPRLRAVDGVSGQLLWTVPLRSEDGLLEMRPRSLAVVEDSSIAGYGHRVVVAGRERLQFEPVIFAIDPSTQTVASIRSYPEFADFSFSLLRTLRWRDESRLFAFTEPLFSSAGPTQYLILDTAAFSPIEEEGGPTPFVPDAVETAFDSNGNAKLQLWIGRRSQIMLADLVGGTTTLLSQATPHDARFIEFEGRPAIALSEETFAVGASTRINILDRESLESLAAFTVSDRVYRIAQQGPETLLFGTGDPGRNGPDRIRRFSLLSGRMNASSSLLGADLLTGNFVDTCWPDCVTYLGNPRGIFEILPPPPELIFGDDFDAVLP